MQEKDFSRCIWILKTIDNGLFTFTLSKERCLLYIYYVIEIIPVTFHNVIKAASHCKENHFNGYYISKTSIQFTICTTYVKERYNNDTIIMVWQTFKGATSCDKV